MTLLHTAGGHACFICGGDCKGFPDIQHLASYPFLEGGIDPMADQEFVIAPQAIEDPELERIVYGAGDRVPMDDAVKYGLVEAPAKAKRAPRPSSPPPPNPSGAKTKRARKPAEDRARKPAENRGRRKS